MRILVAATQFYPEFGGIESSVYYIAKALKKFNHDPVILTGKTRPHLSLSDEVEGIKVIRYPFMKFRNILGIFYPLSEKKAIDKNLSNLLKKEKFDAIWARHPFFICSATRAGFRGKLIYIPAMVKSIFEENEILNFRNFFLKKIISTPIIRMQLIIIEHLERMAIKKSFKVIVFSNLVKKLFCDYYKISEDNFEVIWPGIDPLKFKPSPANRDLLERMGIKEEKIFIYVGRVTRGKKVDLLLEAFSLINNPNSALLIVGTSNELNYFKSLANRIGVSDRVYFIGYQKDIAPYYNISDFLVMPSTLEGFGHVYLEAMASGVPCIAFKTNYPTIRVATEEIIIDGENGFLANEATPQSLAKKMELALNLSPDSYKTMSEYSRKYCIEKYSWDQFVKNILSYSNWSAS